MMTKLSNPSRNAAAFARNAQQELSQLRAALHAAQDGIAGLTRAIKTPIIRPKRQMIKRSVQGLSPLLGIGGSLLGSFLGGDATGNFSSFYRSASQTAAKLTALSVFGQRIR